MTVSRRWIGAGAAALMGLAGAGGLVWAAGGPRGADPGVDEFGRPLRGIPAITPMPLPSMNDPTSDNGPEAGNPLWGITIQSLHTTRERPLFSPSRRPPMPAVIAAPPPPPPRPVVQEKPSLNLLGTVAGDGVGYAIFLDNATHNIVRLKTGEGQNGWILQSVKNREAVLVKNDRTEVMRLPSPTGVRQ